MITAALYASQTVSEFTGYSAFAKAQLGDNSAIASGAPELVVGSDTDSAAIHTCWDSTPEEEFDSGPRFAKFTADGSSNGVTWSIDGSQPVSHTSDGALDGALGEVRLRAGMSVPGMVQWSSVGIQWYRDGKLVDSYLSGNGPMVDERGAEGPMEAEEVLVVSTNVRDADEVVVWGDVAIAYDAGVYPGPDDLFAEVFVFPAE